ncbi:biliverdin-producing heme oxygenase [Erythrobacter sp. THAF29]|uniref:biliverdin-producing heme oxygenase n=1 Tax=Erythrobacter sp. THAF29 TaxID=2587851 RepID=UPI001268304D|nr:biliverdin-producing heme oxygenase [Erythrobacter sp. THAF29]QFT76768.1 hypothetical protein FIU90_04340 [Erythrobacter sp. THAF29]
MRKAGGWDTLENYARFLKLQHAARQPVEAWLGLNAHSRDRPPNQTGLIAQDLAQLGLAPLATDETFAIAGTRTGQEDDLALGVAWVLAGSSLGNLSIAGEIRRCGNAQWPTAFLSDPAMLEFWKRLRAKLENSASEARIDAASRAAIAVFDHFLTHTKRPATARTAAVAEA